MFKKLNKNFIKGNKFLDEIEFYKYYFLVISKNKKIEINQFYIPNSKIQKKNKKIKNFIKTISYSYILLIFQSEIFFRDFFFFLNKGFFKNYVKERNLKISKICEKFFEKKKKASSVKLPWTNEELEDCKGCLEDFLRKNFGEEKYFYYNDLIKT